MTPRLPYAAEDCSGRRTAKSRAVTLKRAEPGSRCKAGFPACRFGRLSSREFQHSELCRATDPDTGLESPVNRQAGKPAPQKRNAFTLVELMIVVALISIMTAMIIPELRGTYEDALLRSTSRKLLNACNIAQSRAVSLNQPHRVRLETTSGKYRIEKRVRTLGAVEFVHARDVIDSEGEFDRRIAIEVRLPGESVSQDSTGPPQDELQSFEPVITFFSDGTADAREVLLQDRQGFRLLLRVNPTTARIRVVEQPPGASL